MTGDTALSDNTLSDSTLSDTALPNSTPSNSTLSGSALSSAALSDAPFSDLSHSSGILDVPLADLRHRTSAKWTIYGPDVLPLPVAEMDVRLAAPIARALHDAVDRSDTGYAGDPAPLIEAFTGFAERRWGWSVEPESVRSSADVAHGVVAVLRELVAPGDGVVLMPPVYPPFWTWLDTVGARPVPVPLTDLAAGGRIDFDGIERALVAGTKVVLLCHPHNPTGLVHDPADLVRLAELAEKYRATVLSDEIHAPMAYPGSGFRPYLTLGPAALRTGIAFTSASKAWNLAGLKCALIVATGDRRQVLDRLPPELGWGVGQFGAIAGAAAFADGDAWLDQLLGELPGRAALLDNLLAEHLPTVRMSMPQAGYLAWLDCRELGLGNDPAVAFLERGGVALHAGPDFGGPGTRESAVPGPASGVGFARINFGCSAELLEQAVTRMAGVRTHRRS